MKRLFYIMSVAAMLMMSGCSFEEMKVEPDVPQSETYKVQIYGDIHQQPATKVTTDGFCTGDEVGVYLVNYDGETPGILKLEDNQADNVKFHYDENGEWVSEYDIYYKDNETNVDFYGYYPYADPSSIEAYPFEVARDQSKGAEHGQMATYEASDFLWANTKNVTPTASKIVLTFRHQMSSARVRFSQGTGWDDAEEYAAVTKEVLVTNTIRKSTINLATGVVTPEGEVPLTGIVPMKDYDEFRAIVVPQTVAAGHTLLTLTIDGRPRHYVREVDTEYLPGKITTYDLSVSKKPNTGEYEVELTGVSITAWEADNVSHGDDAREYVVVHNAVPGGLEKTVVERLEMDPTKIKNLKLTGNITTEDYTFMRSKMTSLQRLNLKEVESVVDGVYKIPSGAMSGKSTLVKCILPDKLERIEESAFGSTGLSGIVLLPEGLKYVSGFNNTSISNVSFPSTLEIIGRSAFRDCRLLTCNLTFPESLQIIEESAFYNSAITGTLVFPINLKDIGSYTFRDCKGLSGSIVIPEGVTYIGACTFADAGFTGELRLPDSIETIMSGAFSGTGFKGELELPQGLNKIESEAFRGTSFTSVVFPTELMVLESYVFKSCQRLSGLIELPRNISVIPENLFSNCPLISGVKLHPDVEAIGEYAFENCYGITQIISEVKVPPTLGNGCFNGVAKDNFTVEVPEASVNLYKNASKWNEFLRFSAYRDFSISRGLFRTLNDEHSKTSVLRAPSGDSWSVESQPDWVTVTPSSGTGKVDVTVTVSELVSGGGDRTGEIVFLLDGKDYRSTMTVEQYDYEYGDGDVVELQKATVGNGVNIVLMGDCFDAKDISEGKYLSAMEEAYGYFFDIEPYLTYKDYFNVYGVFGVSSDSGIGTVNTIKESRYGSQYSVIRGELGSRVEPDFDIIFTETCKAPINDDVSTTLVIVIENTSECEGTCFMWGDGSAVAIVPMSVDPAPFDFRGIVHHEAGGHGFGKLSDEYIYHNAFMSSCQCHCCGEHVESFKIMKSYGFFDNVSLEGSVYNVPWAHMIFDPQYSNTVDVYEGAYYHSRGVYRSEPTSCMNNNIPYYNAISREAMVKRIKKYAGEEYSFEDFKANDKESLPSVTTKGWMWSEENTNASSRFDQMPPKFMGEKPMFKKSEF